MEQLHFRTDRVAPAQRFESWRETLFDTYYRLDCHTDGARMPSAPFRGVLESRVNGGVRCSRIASSPNRVVQSQRASSFGTYAEPSMSKARIAGLVPENVDVVK